MNDPGFDLLKSVMDAAALRQRVFAHNLANLNTPGFRRMEVRFEEELRRSLESGGAPKAPRMVEGDTGPVLELETTGMTKSALLYDTAAVALQAKVALLRLAMGRPGAV
jgi:flagellar basal-body rod protein FlgB